MARKPETHGVEKPPSKRATKAKEKAQRERFIEAAREHGVDETGAEFERALGRIIPAKKTS